MANNHTTQVAVVMVPLPAQGHLNQLLHLSRRVSARNIPVYYVGADTHIRQAKLRFHNRRHLDNDDDQSCITAGKRIHFHEFPTTPFDNPPPDPNSLQKFPSQIVPSLKASTHLRQPVFAFVNALSTIFRRVVVIHDSLMAYVVQDIDSIPTAECYTFCSISAVAVSSWEATSNDDWPDNLATEARNILAETPSMKGYYPPEFQEFLNLQTNSKKISCGEIYNSCREIEGPYLDFLAKRKMINEEQDQKMWALGPFNPLSLSSNPNNNNRHECLKWLDKHDPNSVILVSFGTTSSFSDKQIEEIAKGLEKSNQKFIWVLREADKGDIFAGEIIKKSTDEALPNGFEERVKERGIVLREWAPQLEILSHRSTGGFVSHCGWNSCLEAITMGVAIATWPLHSDQPANAVLVTKGLKIGVEIKKWCAVDEEELVTADVVEEVVRKLMVSEEGGAMRKRAAALGGAIRNSMAEGGAASEEMTAFISHITR